MRVIRLVDPHFLSIVIQHKVSFVHHSFLEKLVRSHLLFEEALDGEPLVTHGWGQVSLVYFNFVIGPFLPLLNSIKQLFQALIWVILVKIVSPRYTQLKLGFLLNNIFII